MTVENVNVPGYRITIDRNMYQAMLEALRKILPNNPPRLTQKEMFEKVSIYLPETLFPGGTKEGWWVKTVHLDQEAKGNFVRESSKPLR